MSWEKDWDKYRQKQEKICAAVGIRYPDTDHLNEIVKRAIMEPSK